jgi:uncharacterized protein (UPF0264 family)
LKILISIRSLEELIPAIDGGADIIDLKNPDEGSLGAPFPWLIKKIRNYNDDFTLSVAIGDMPNLPGTAALASYGAASCGVDIIKVGLYGPRSFNEGVKLLKSVVNAVKEINQEILVVGTGYADFEYFKGIDALDIPEICQLAGADIAMLDTYSKNGQKLFHFINSESLRIFINKAHDYHLLTALAGSLEQKDISNINDLGADIIGFRGAACSGSDRKSGLVEVNRVRNIVEISRFLKRKEKILSKSSITN